MKKAGIQTRYRLNSLEKELRKKKEGAELPGLKAFQIKFERGMLSA